MKRVLIFGTGSTGQRIYGEIKEKVQVVGFLDNDKSRWKMEIDHIPVIGNARMVKEVEYDEILICSLTGFKIIKEELLEAGVQGEKIRSDYVETQVNARINFLYDFADMNRKKVESYAIAEGGVFQGEFAKEINACFPNNKLYLFDTFEGFDKRDTVAEEKNQFLGLDAHHLNITSEELVLGKLPFRENAIIRKGYFPDTTRGLESTKYFFVNLDFDLYKPILEGLRFFFPRMVDGGCILIHDYFNPGYPGVKQAVLDYQKENNFILYKFPIGDHCSIGILKI